MSHDVSDFEQEVIQRSHTIPVLCDFWAPWCGPCSMLGPVLEQLAKQANGRWVLAKVNTDVNPAPAQCYGVRGIPDVKLFYKGKVMAEFSGAQSPAVVAQFLEKHLPELGDPAFKAAKEAFTKLDFTETIRQLESATDPLDDKTRFLLAKTRVWTDPGSVLSQLRAIKHPDEKELDALRFIASALMSDPSMPSEDSDNRRHLLAAFGELKLQHVEQAMNHLTEILWDHPKFGDGIAVRWQRALILYLGIRHPLSKRHFNACSTASSLIS